MGNKLKTAKSILIKTIKLKIKKRTGRLIKPEKNRIANPKIKASERLAAGPAKATLAGPYF